MSSHSLIFNEKGSRFGREKEKSFMKFVDLDSIKPTTCKQTIINWTLIDHDRTGSQNKPQRDILAMKFTKRIKF